MNILQGCVTTRFTDDGINLSVLSKDIDKIIVFLTHGVE